jgi:hypothetical protein
MPFNSLTAIIEPGDGFIQLISDRHPAQAQASLRGHALREKEEATSS